MLKRLGFFLALIMLLLSLLVSCSVGDGTDADGNGDQGSGDTSGSGDSSGGDSSGDSSDDGGLGGTTPSGSLIYDGNTTLHIVIDKSEYGTQLTNSMTEVMRALSDKTASTSYVSSSDAKIEHELVIGRTSRPISEAAYKRLERVRVEVEDELEGALRVVIYSDGSSVAIAYDEGEGDAALVTALKYFKENCILDKLTLSEGTVYRDVVLPYDYYQSIDDELVAAKWQALADKVGGEAGEELALSLKELYTLYSDELISWFANLYDAETGGWYYSNSARDNEGFLPDAESTQQALRFIEDSGMIATIGSLDDAIPDEMSDKIVYFIKNLQHPNGYFYHPQWGKDRIDDKISRRSRDLGWCVSILSSFGELPYYDTPTGVKGTGRVDAVSADGSLTSQLGSSVALAVSRVVAVSSTEVDYRLENEESFRAYLATLDIKTGSYGVGNELTAFSSEIIARDKVLKSKGYKYSLMDILIDWLNENQNPENGLWHSESDYYGVNGLMKISGVYGKAGVLMPNPEIAARSAMAAITTTEEPDGVTDVYNTWYAVNRVLNHMNEYGTKEDIARAEEIRVELAAEAPTAIYATAQKLSLFSKPDGSFSYTQLYSSELSQQMPAAMPNSIEGDVNATLMCSSDILNYLYSSLGLSSYSVPIYTYNDWRKYTSILDRLAPITKAEEEMLTEPISFDTDREGEPPLSKYIEVSNRSKDAGGLIQVIDDVRTEDVGMVLSASSVAGTSDSINVYCSSRSDVYSCNVFEGDFCLVSTNTDYPIQVSMSSDTGTVYMFTIRLLNGRVAIIESTSGTAKSSKDTIIASGIELGEWFNIKVEYFVGTDSTVRIRFYLNGELVAVTDNYCDPEGDRLVKGKGFPKSKFNYTQIWFMKGYNIELLLDNLVSYKTKEKYKPVSDSEPQPPINIDAPVTGGSEGGDAPLFTDTFYNDSEREGTRYDFSEKLGMDKLYNRYAGDGKAVTAVPTVTDLSGGKLRINEFMNWKGFALANTKGGEGGSGKVYVFETDFKWTAGSQSAAQINSGAAFIGFLGEHTSVDNSYMSAALYMSFDKNDHDVLHIGNSNLEKGKLYNIRIEYTVGGAVTLFVDGTKSGAGNVLSGANANADSFESFGFYFRKEFLEPLSFTLDNVYMGIAEVEDTGIKAPTEDKNFDTLYGDENTDGTRIDFADESDLSYLWTNDNSTVHVTPSTTTVQKGYMTELSTKWRGFAISSGIMDEFVSGKYVFEADILIETPVYSASGSVFVGFLGDTDGDVKLMNNGKTFFDTRLYFTEDGTGYSLFDSETLEVGNWCNLRFVYDTAAHSVDVYVNGIKTGTTTIEASGGNNSTDTSKYIGFTFYPRVTGIKMHLDNVFLGVLDGEKVTPPETVTILDTPTGADGTVVIMHDDGNFDTMSIIDKVFSDYGLVGNVAIYTDNGIYTGEYGSGTFNTTSISKWQQYLNTGRWQVSSHSRTHTFWGLTDTAETVTYTDSSGNEVQITLEAGTITDEVVNSQKILREAFPDQRVLTFAYPGFWAQRSLGMDRFSAVARLIVESCYIAGRDSYGNAYVDTNSDVDWKFSPSWQLDADNVDEIISVVEGITGGKMAVIFTHKVVSDDTETLGSNSMYEADFRRFAAKVAEMRNAGNVWCAFYEYAVLYATEKQNSTLTYVESEDSITINLTTELDTEIYNYPLTVRVLIPDTWQAAKITQNGNTEYSTVKTVDGTRVADFAIIPGAGEAVIEEASLSDVTFYTYYGDETVDGNRYGFEDGSVPDAIVMHNSNGQEANTVTVTADSNGNKVLCESATSWYGFALLSGDDTAYTAGKYVFETDFTMTKAVYRSNGAAFSGFLGKFTVGGVENATTDNACFSNAYIAVAENLNTYNWFGYTLNVGTTYNIRTVYDVTTDITSVYINGELVGSADSGCNSTVKGNDDSVFYGFMFYPRISGYEFTLDNVFIGVVDGVAAE